MNDTELRNVLLALELGLIDCDEAAAAIAAIEEELTTAEPDNVDPPRCPEE
jgi:hypothetical protein